MSSQNNEWLKNKLWEQEVKKWTSKFIQVKGNRGEWQKTYQEYQQSSVWAEKRKQILSRANGRCESCGAIVVTDSLLDIHHLTYDRVGGNESLDDLKALCYVCHQKADRKRTDLSDQRRKSNYYQSRLNGFGSSKYGDGWSYDHDEREVEIEFITYLYKKYCE
jgi:5-methylcytosine-specific restriction endonuclease McrA